MTWKQRLLRGSAAGTFGVGALMALGITYAAWTATGSGSGASGATSALALSTVDSSASTTAQLYPGGTGDVVVVISNPNPFSVLITSITGDGPITSDAGSACTASTGVTFTGSTDLSVTVPASGTAQVTLEDAASMDSTSDNSCQGAVFTIPVAIA